MDTKPDFSESASDCPNIAQIKINTPVSSSRTVANTKEAIRIFKYVRHEDREAYERDGWIFAADLGPTHGQYAVLMEKIEPTP